MKKNWIVAEFNFADIRWCTCLFDLGDKIHDVKNNKHVCNIRKAVAVDRQLVQDENGVVYQRFYDNSLLAR